MFFVFLFLRGQNTQESDRPCSSVCCRVLWVALCCPVLCVVKCCVLIVAPHPPTPPPSCDDEVVLKCPLAPCCVLSSEAHHLTLHKYPNNFSVRFFREAKIRHYTQPSPVIEKQINHVFRSKFPTAMHRTRPKQHRGPLKVPKDMPRTPLPKPCEIRDQSLVDSYLTEALWTSS